MSDPTTIELAIGGMTCASCAARVEKKLNRMEGVTATVNYATEKAKVVFAGTVSPQDLVATVEATGYSATLPPPPRGPATQRPALRRSTPRPKGRRRQWTCCAAGCSSARR